MKSILLILISLISIQFFAQQNRVDYDRDTKWNFGINAGGTWAEKELGYLTKRGFSGGITLGRSIYEKEGRLLSFDLRGRLLGGQTSGWNASPSYDTLIFPVSQGGYGFKNYRFGYSEGALELVVNAHRLRERTGILLSVYGALGTVNHTVKHNYKNGDEFYDYTSIDSTLSSEVIINELRNKFNDYKWEKENDFFNGKRRLWMPSIGVGLGYQFTPQFSIGVEHRVTFGLNDELDGVKDGKNDRYHYSSFNLRWNLFRGRESEGASGYVPEERPIPNTGNNQTNNTGNNSGENSGGATAPTQVPVGNKPLVKIALPLNNGEVVYTSSYTVNAKVYYVEGTNNITFKQNGISVSNFYYNVSTNVFEAQVVLKEGENVFEIIGVNNFGSDSDVKTIIFQEPCNKPEINFTQPINGSSLISPSVGLSAQVTNIINPSQITLKHNGMIISSFSYNQQTHIINSNLMCVQGTNTFEVIANNSCGSESKSVSVSYKNQQQVLPPVVTIVYPSGSPFTVNSNSSVVNGFVTNVVNASQISVTVNGVSTPNFTYDVSTQKISLIAQLNQGSNIVVIKASTAGGIDSKNVVINYKRQELVLPPVVTIVYPSVSPFTVNSNSSVVNGFVTNVASANQINVTINGIATSNFTYDVSTQKISLIAQLNQGSNVVKIKASNTGGVDSKEVFINYKKQEIVLPPVVTIVNPSSSPFIVNSNKGVLMAKVLNVNGVNDIEVTQNNSVIPITSFNAVTREMVVNTVLNGGNNLFVVKATNTGGVDSKSSTIVYKRQALELAPVVSFVTPRLSPFETESAVEQVVGKVANIASANQISVVLNGAAVNQYGFDVSTQLLTFSSALLLGNNTIKIEATNTAGSDSKTQIIYRKEPCVAPQINYQIPVSSPYLHTERNGNMAFTFSTANFSSESQIAITNNNYAVPFTLERTNGNIWGTVPLQEGENIIVVTGVNNCGRIVKELKVAYVPTSSKLDPPSITIVSPNSFPFQTSVPNVTVLGSIINVSSQNNVQVTMDGINIPFSYNTATKELLISVSLSSGSHQIRVKASNNYGDDMEVFDLVNTAPQLKAPVVRYTNIGSGNSYRNPFSCPQRSFNIEGKVLNTENTTLSVYVNATRITNYSYNSSTGVFSIPVVFELQGQGTQRRVEVEVKASNSTGISNKKAHLVYVVQNVSPAISPNASPNKGTEELNLNPQEEAPVINKEIINDDKTIAPVKTAKDKIDETIKPLQRP